MTPDDAAFLAAMAAAPHDRLPRRVYADFLDELNDPRGHLLRLDDALLDIPPAADRYWHLWAERERVRDTLDPVWVAAARVGLDAAPLLAHGWPGDWKGRWRTVRVAAERLLGKPVPDIGGHQDRIAEAERDLGLTLPPSAREWIAFTADAAEPGVDGGFLPDPFQMVRWTSPDAVCVDGPFDGGSFLVVEAADYARSDPPLIPYVAFDGGAEVDDEGGRYDSLAAHALLRLILECHGSGGSLHLREGEAAPPRDELIAAFGPSVLVGGRECFERLGLCCWLDPTSAVNRCRLFASVRGTVAAEEVPEFLTRMTTERWLSGLFIPEELRALEPAQPGRRTLRRVPSGHLPQEAFDRGCDCREGDGVPQSHAEAVRWFQVAAEYGHTYAAAALGQMCQRGLGTRVDYEGAIRLYRDAIRRGDPWGDHNLGCMHRDGLGVQQDHAEAARHFRAAADLGLPEAMSTLGCCYWAGEGVPQDDNEAVRWIRMACDRDLPLGAYNLALAHYYGRGVPGDDEEAARLARRAVALEAPGAHALLGLMCRGGRGVPRDHAEAARLFRLGADAGDPAAAYRLGCAFEEGEGVIADVAEAAGWYRRGAEGGDPFAQSALARLYRWGRGVPADMDEALRWRRAAAAQGHARSHFELGVAYRDGTGVAKDEGEAARHFRHAAEQGIAEGMCEFGRCLLRGEGVPQDDVEAGGWFRKAAGTDHAIATFYLGWMHEAGRGVPQDDAEALKWYRIAAGMGQAEAKARLAELGEG